MRWLPLALVLASTSAAADDRKPTRLTGKLDGTTARFTARYALTVGAGAWSQTQAEVALPRAGVVTAGRASIRGATHELALIGADAAQAKFSALGDEPVKSGAKTSAVMIEGGSEAVSISVASALSGTLNVELEIAAPTCYVRERRYVAVPESWGPIAGTVRKPIVSDDELQRACGRPGEEGRRWIAFASRGVAKLASGDRVGVTGDRVDLGGDAVVRVELDLANALADIPRDLATVLVVDGSRSLGSEEQRAQRDVVRAYLKRAPASRVQVVAFSRFAQPLLSGWMTATEGAAAVEAALAKLPAANGSNFDAGLAEAATWLGRIKGTKRIVLLTDERMAQRLARTPPATLKQLLPPGTLVHVVVPRSVSGRLSREDAEPRIDLAAATEGMRMTAGPEDDGPLDVTRLVKPTSLDHLTIVARGWSALSRSDREITCEDEATVDEGAACTWWGRTKHPAQPITVEGKIWGKVWRRVLAPTKARAVDLARELSTHVVTPLDLSDLATEQARAVNVKFSLYAEWGGPGTYELHGGGGHSSGVCGCDGPGGIGHGTGTGTGTLVPSRAQIDLRTQLAAQLATCNLGRERVEVDVELTLDEIADVHVTAKTAQGADKQRIERCVAEVVWASSPTIVQPRPHQVMSFVAGG